jgi:hypothetical protein
MNREILLKTWNNNVKEAIDVLFLNINYNKYVVARFPALVNSWLLAAW